MPQITETWGSAYIQILIVLLVFVIGIPAALYSQQPEPIRTIIVKRNYLKSLIWGPGVTIGFILFLLSSGYLWYFHPCSGTILSFSKAFFASISLNIVLLLSIIVWYLSFYYSWKDKLINIIKENYIKKYKNKQIIGLDDEIRDLINLCEYFEAVHEKNLVIDALSGIISHIVMEVTDGKYTYKGYELTFILRQLNRIVKLEIKPCSENNLLKIMKIYEIIITTNHKRKMQEYSDYDTAIENIKDLSIIAIYKRFDALISEGIRKVRISNKHLLEIGIEAFKVGKVSISCDALTRLKKLYISDNSYKQHYFHYIALISYFWVFNEISRDIAKEFISPQRRFERPRSEDLIEAEIQFRDQIETAQNIRTMRNSLYPI
jgi:hypothetical protein